MDLELFPGSITRVPVAKKAPQFADPHDDRHGVYCYQITPRAMEEGKSMAKSEVGGAVDVFFSYCHTDDRYRQEIDKHLALLKREGLISSCFDHQIKAGRDLDEGISEQLGRARIILLLLSSDFIASNYCYSIELGRAIERHANGAARVIPIIIRPCDWHSAPFGKLKALPKDGKAVSAWRPRDKAYLDIAKGIREVVDEIRTEAKVLHPGATGPVLASVSGDTVAVSAKLSVIAHLEILKQVGCPCLNLRLVCTSQRPAKIRGAELQVKGSHYIEAFQKGFNADFGYKPVRGQPDPNDCLGFCFIPASPPNTTNGFVIERDDARHFLLPGMGFPLLLFHEAAPEDISIIVDFIDGRKERVLCGVDIQPQIVGLYEMCKASQYTLSPVLSIGIRLHLLSETTPDVSAIGTVNQKAVSFCATRSFPAVKFIGTVAHILRAQETISSSSTTSLRY